MGSLTALDEISVRERSGSLSIVLSVAGKQATYAHPRCFPGGVRRGAFLRKIASPPSLIRHFRFSGLRCQMLSLYSRMVRSEENTPDIAVLVTAILSHLSRLA